MRCIVAVAAAVNDLAHATMATCASRDLSQHNASVIDPLAGVCIHLSVYLRVVHVFFHRRTCRLPMPSRHRLWRQSPD